MTAKTIVLGTLLLAMPAIALAQDASSFDLAKVKIDGCAGERFDFALPESPGTKVSLCSNPGATKDEKAAMLESAIKQLETTDRMQAEKRDGIIALIRAKAEEVRQRS